eukprot:scaffold85_cov145-Alexandrium_tamarense.AAC.9
MYRNGATEAAKALRLSVVCRKQPPSINTTTTLSHRRLDRVAILPQLSTRASAGNCFVDIGDID